MNLKMLNVYRYPEGDQGGAGGGAGGAGAGAGAVAGAGDGAGAPKWPDNWREQIAGTDEKELGQLKRYTTPADIWKKAREFETRISKGDLRPAAPPKDATPEQMAAWRAEMGVPPEPTKYTLQLKDGLVIGEQDKPIIDGILTKLHGENLTNAQASAMVNAYYEAIEAETKSIAETEARTKQEVADALNREWGAEYRGNMNRIAGILDANLPAGSELRAKLDQTIATNAEFAKLMESLARQINPAGVLLPGAGANVASALEDEIKAIEKDMAAPSGTPENKAYWGDEKRQERYRQLLAARDSAKR